MKTANLLILALAWSSSAVLAAEEGDWRLQLLEEEGLELDQAGADGFVKGMVPSEKRFLELVPLLSSEDFAARERTQKEILRMGLAAKPWLDSLPDSDDPEVNFRIREIRGQLGEKRRWSKAELLKHAVEGLLREKSGEKTAKDIPQVFAELFRDKAADLEAPYRDFTFDASPGLKGEVAEGFLKLSGRGPIEGDQRLILSAGKICGKKVFPDRFRIEVMLGGTPGGEGGYHIGVSIGKVRALFHPGYDSGAFRFEHNVTHKTLAENAEMGFTPATDKLAAMGIEVERQPNGDVELRITVIPDGKKGRKFSTRTTVPAAEIGELDSISLDRSGRVGGDALFDNLVVEMPAQ